jgi:hypothetical protein
VVQRLHATAPRPEVDHHPFNKAYALLNVLMGNGRSQVQVIEEALDRVSNAVEPDTLAARMARLNAILDRIDPSDIPSMAEFDAMTYDEYGLPR